MQIVLHTTEQEFHDAHLFAFKIDDPNLRRYDIFVSPRFFMACDVLFLLSMIVSSPHTHTICEVRREGLERHASKVFAFPRPYRHSALLDLAVAHNQQVGNPS